MAAQLTAPLFFLIEVDNKTQKFLYENFNFISAQLLASSTFAGVRTCEIVSMEINKYYVEFFHLFGLFS